MEAKDMNEMEPRIIEAAKRVFVRKGYEAATMSDVAAEVGIGRTALHYYYRTKEILFDAIFGQLLSSLLPNIDRVLDEKSTMLEKMPVIVDLYMGIVRANPMFPNFVVGELNRDPERLFQTVLRPEKNTAHLASSSSDRGGDGQGASTEDAGHRFSFDLGEPSGLPVVDPQATSGGFFG